MEGFLSSTERRKQRAAYRAQSRKIYVIFGLLIIAFLFVSKYYQTLEQEETYSGPKKIQVDNSGNIYLQLQNQIFKFDKEGNQLFWIGKPENGQGPFDGYIDFSVDDKENIYVADSKNKKIYLYNKEGALLSAFGKQGSSEGEFKSIIKISVDEVGNIYVLDMYNARVQAFSNDGKFLWFCKIGVMMVPDEITIDKEGKIIVIDAQKDNISTISSSGKRLKTINLRNSKLLGLAGIITTDTSNNYIIADYFTPNIWKIDSAGKEEKLNVDFSKKEKIAISDITSDENGNLWVVDERQFVVLKIDAEGKTKSFMSNDLGNLLKELESKWKRIMLMRRLYLILIFTLVLISLVLLLYKKR
ncbi:NHL repeat-containing protein [candidate division WOR-3 bacterium]|nr:NHL repeat-containing protein [candidate division WOR-3 bacterium]